MNNGVFSKTFVAKNGTKFEYGFRYLKGNEKPYFFISFEECDRFGRLDSCGTPSTEALQKHAPQLAHLRRWHLCDIDARPMHYEANGLYWLEKAWQANYPGPAADEFVRHFESTVVFGACSNDGVLIPAIEGFHAWASRRLPDLKNAFQADLAGHELWGPAQKWWATLRAA